MGTEIARDWIDARGGMGAGGSSVTLAAMPKLEESSVPMVVETSSAASITGRDNPWTFASPRRRGGRRSARTVRGRARRQARDHVWHVDLGS
jgi:hypothetical protein